MMAPNCSEHRDGLRLLALKLRLTEEDMAEKERMALNREVADLEARLRME
jgi:hypothetical protein